MCLCRDSKPGYHPLPVSIQRREEKPGRGVRRPGLPLTGIVWPFGINSVSSRGGEALKLWSTSSCCHWLGCGQAEGQHPSLLCGSLVESPEAGERTWADSKQPGAACRLGRSLTPGLHPPRGREQCVGSTSSTWFLASVPHSALPDAFPQNLPRFVHSPVLILQIGTQSSVLLLLVLDHAFLTRVLLPPRGENLFLG